MRISFRKLDWFKSGTFSIYASGNIVFQVSSLFSELYILNLVSVNGIGAWQLALLLQSYVILSRLGIINAFNREYPFLLGSKDQSKANLILGTTHAHVKFSCFFQSIFFLLSSGYCYLILENNLLAKLFIVMTVFTSLDALVNFHEAKLRANLNFSRLGKIKLASSLLPLILLYFPYNFEFDGLLVRVILLQVFIYTLYKVFGAHSSRALFKQEIWLELFSFGWKIWLWSYIKNFNKGMPKLFLSISGGLTSLGLFAPINWMLLSVSIISNNFSTFLYSNLSKLYGEGRDNLGIDSLLIASLIFILCYPFVFFLYLNLEFFVDLLIPRYAEVLKEMGIALLASPFEIFYICTSNWVSSKNWKMMYIFIALDFIIRLVFLAYFMLTSESLIYGASMGIMFSSIFIAFTIVLMILIEYLISKNLKKN